MKSQFVIGTEVFPSTQVMKNGWRYAGVPIRNDYEYKREGITVEVKVFEEGKFSFVIPKAILIRPDRSENIEIVMPADSGAEVVLLMWLDSDWKKVYLANMLPPNFVTSLGFWKLELNLQQYGKTLSTVTMEGASCEDRPVIPFKGCRDRGFSLRRAFLGR